MNNWLFFALLAPAIYALVVFIDKYILSKQVKDYQSMPLYAAIVGSIAGTLIWFSTGRPLLGLTDTIIALSAGVLTILSFVAYYKAVSYEEASNINILFQMGPVFILIFALIFLGERIGVRQLIGFAIIFFAVLAVSVEKREKTKNKFRLSSAFYYILIYDILWAASAILMKFSLEINTLSATVSYPSWGVGIGGLALYIFSPSIRHSFHKSLSVISKKTLSTMLLNEMLFVLARWITYFAYMLGTVAIVSVLEGTQVYYGIFYGWIFTILAPSVVKENITKQHLLKKASLATILFIGIWFVY